jgi:hypothetical protein
MLHATFPTIDKKLFQGTSMFLRSYRYWKDDAKDEAEDKGQRHFMPSTPEGHIAYWNYNGLDCAATLELCIHLLDLWFGEREGRYPHFKAGYDHAWLNYTREFALQFGPALYMSMTGMRGSRERQMAVCSKLELEAAEKTARLQKFIGDPDFNPKSAPQTAHLYYDLLRMPVKKRHGRTTDKKVVQAYADEHPVWEDVIRMVAAAKEPANNAAKYGRADLFWGDDIFMCNMKAGNTTTARFASARHNFKVGTNFQNFPYPMRVLGTAFENEWLVSADYSQSDSYFVAFESQDPTMMETVTDDLDTHSVHVEFFFGHPYEEVVAGAAAKEPWCVDPVTGVRQIIKKVSHGTNYDMGGDTMLLNVRKDAAIAMIKALVAGGRGAQLARACGVPITRLAAPANLPDPVLAKACSYAQALYYERYPKTRDWKTAAVDTAVADHGVIEMFGGTRTVILGDVRATPRFVPAAKGQGGTSGNINNSLLRLYYLNPDMWDQGFRLTLQVHDENVAAIPSGRLDLAKQMVRIMEAPCTIHGRTFTIPVEADVSKTWCGTYAVGLDKCKGDPALAAKLIAEKEAALEKELFG